MCGFYAYISKKKIDPIINKKIDGLDLGPGEKSDFQLWIAVLLNSTFFFSPFFITI